ncbi:hypothetical protein [Chondromyces crocatus]|uniref:Uncharacterized protein n=1 Tax=Chondromyces crocatus TaxID=52 RepID=A0A0K1EAU5_CHOCO|nr:hypothetical protein [Chondromyces crocatus]AKT37990.1 uncharacterized protein CMC5_021310 [Chondromyces crocatus]
MAREIPARFGVTDHATRRGATLKMGIGAILFAYGILLLCLIDAAALLGATLCAIGVALLGLGAMRRAHGPTVQMLHRAENLLFAGHLGEAQELLDLAEASTRTPLYLRAVDLHRATIALRKGALEDARLHADRGIQRPLSRVSRDDDQVTLASGYALRALVRASMADREGARADIDEVRRCPVAPLEALSRAELAHAILLERADDRAALARHLREKRALLLETPHLRERAIVRAYQRMLKARATSVYREAAEKMPGDEPTLDAWVARLAPGAAAFVHAQRARVSDDPARPAPARRDHDPRRPPAPDPLARATAEARAKLSSSHPLRQTLAALTIFVTVVLTTWHVIAPRVFPALVERLATGDGISTTHLDMLGALWVGLFATTVASIAHHTRRQHRRFLEASSALARGDEERALAALTRLGHARSRTLAASAHLALATAAERRADLATALQHCEEALARLDTPSSRALASDQLVPSILAERAFLFAATGRDTDAAAEIALVTENYPAHAGLDAARLRVDLTLAASQSDLTRVAELAEQAGELPLSPRDELLTALGRAAADPRAAGAIEFDRLEAELRDDPRAHRWLHQVAPTVLAAFARTEEQAPDPVDLICPITPGTRTEPLDAPHAKTDADATRDAELEAEASAEAERDAALATLTPPRPRASPET